MKGYDRNDYKKTEIAKDIPDTFDELVNFIVHHLKCPLDIRTDGEYKGIDLKLYYLWYDIVNSFSIDKEIAFVRGEENNIKDYIFDNELEVIDMRPSACNIVKWIEKAKKIFSEKTKVFEAIGVDEKYKKHILRGKMSLSEANKLAKKEGNSYFLSEIGSKEIKEIILSVSHELFEPMINLTKIRFSVECNKNIGVTDKGEVTNYMFVEIYSGNSEAYSHAYPCSYEEAMNKIGTYEMKVADLIDYDEFEEEKPNELVIKVFHQKYHFTD